MEQIQFFISETNNRFWEVRELAVYNLFCDIVDRTPIWYTGTEITGNAKYNWTVSIGTMNPQVLSGTDSTKGTKTKNRAWAQLKKVSGGDDDIYIHNSAPQIMLLENGGYTQSPQKGSRNPKTGKYEIRSSGGYSKQAPGGVMKIQVLKWNTYINDAAKVVQK